MKDIKFVFPRYLFALLAALLLLQACGGEKPVKDEEAEKIAADPDYQAKYFLRKEYMEVYYYWRDEVKDQNAKLKPYDYEIYDFFDKLLYSDDRWSWMCDKDYYISDETGVVTGTWGLSLGQPYEFYGDYSLRVRYIYPGSPLEPFGITRGALLRKIDGKSVEDDETGFTSEKLQYFQENYYKSPQTFTFRLVDGRDTTFKVSMASSLSTRPGLITRIFQPGDYPGLTEPVGYFHYLAFKANFLSDIENAMDAFKSAGVRTLIMDLRYNGGGDSRASQLLVNCLAPRSSIGKPYVIRHHSDYLASLSDSYSDAKQTVSIAENSHALEPERIYFIVGSGTASASEVVMNGLKPFMGDRIQMVGDTTYGKPNGMYVLMYPGEDDDYDAYDKGDFSRLKWVFLPICFFSRNANGDGIPWTGFVPDKYYPDDLYHDFGVEEAEIRACLSHIVSGQYPELVRASGGNYQTKAPGRSEYRIDREEDSRHYGRFTVRKSDF